jgi:AcrR family transcriptional regulator
MLAQPRVLRRPTQRRAKEKVEAILDAADLLLRTTPADRLVMRDVARVAGVKPATLYDYFSTKELLLRALEDRAWARAAERAQSAVKPPEEAPLAFAISAIVETFMMEMAKAARTIGLTPESPFGQEQRALLGARFAAFAAKALGELPGELRSADLHLRMSIAIETVAMLTWVAARDHARELEDGSYAREVGRLIAHYFVRDPQPAV